MGKEARKEYTVIFAYNGDFQDYWVFSLLKHTKAIMIECFC